MKEIFYNIELSLVYNNVAYKDDHIHLGGSGKACQVIIDKMIAKAYTSGHVSLVQHGRLKVFPINRTIMNFNLVAF